MVVIVIYIFKFRSAFLCTVGSSRLVTASVAKKWNLSPCDCELWPLPLTFKLYRDEPAGQIFSSNIQTC